jgi:hypothetical protein
MLLLTARWEMARNLVRRAFKRQNKRREGNEMGSLGCLIGLGTCGDENLDVVEGH